MASAPEAFPEATSPRRYNIQAPSRASPAARAQASTAGAGSANRASSPAPSASPDVMIRGTISACFQAGMPRDARRMRDWQYRNPAAKTTRGTSRAGWPNSQYPPPTAISGPATMPSRVIHEVWGWKKTLRARQGLPISSQTMARPSPTSARPATRDSPPSPSRTLASTRPVPAPPPMKLPAARKSQLRCSRAVIICLMAVLRSCHPDDHRKEGSRPGATFRNSHRHPRLRSLARARDDIRNGCPLKPASWPSSVPQVIESRPRALVLVLAEPFVVADQPRHDAVGVLDIAEAQGARQAGIDAGRRGLGVDSGHLARLDAGIDALDAEGAFGDHADLLLGGASLLLGDGAGAVDVLGRLHLVTGLVGARDGAVGTADADVVVDGDDAVVALAGGGRRTDLHAGRLVAMLAAGGQEDAPHVGVLPGLDVEDLAPLHAGRRGVGFLAGCRAGLAADAAPQVGDHHIAGHAGSPGPSTRRSATRTTSAPEPVASVSSSDIWVMVFNDGKLRSLA
ncbi:hypothetical protein amb2016 [Paramagnetospirillum magneticum AMB-1]|uniref:Uncharacterized protein n=1 Tax=Paramagnetospirillum magneticum (strain ATCC 700264 / AMB-1) TaxID=342108 RepID=Q2W5Q5_PARM1|nr:hypothetical protein amb2016 [Paramagnetospirillum magneticum AMB-1]